MNGIVIGVKCNGEHIHFEYWVYRAWRSGNLTDEFLLSQIRQCDVFGTFDPRVEVY